MGLHPAVARAFDEIDAGIFSGDEFHHPDTLAALKKYLLRWERALPSLIEMAAQVEEDS